jgi:hypothetical protein
MMFALAARRAVPRVSSQKRGFVDYLVNYPDKVSLNRCRCWGGCEDRVVERDDVLGVSLAITKWELGALLHVIPFIFIFAS